MKTGLAICNTPYQLLCLLRIIYCDYKEYTFDVIITDNITNYQELADGASKSGFFSKVFVARSKDYAWGRGVRKKELIKDRLNAKRNPEKILKKYISKEMMYDVFFFANIENFTKLIYTALVSKNSKIKSFLYEDGFGSYSNQNVQIYERFRSVKKFIYKAVDWKDLIFNIYGQYLFEPNMTEHELPVHNFKIKKIEYTEHEFINIINNVFNYDNMTDSYDRPIIFFEESLRVSGLDIDDVGLVKSISNIVGSEKIMIKQHPRSGGEAFINEGYKVNNNTAIPWEVIVMNNADIRNKLFVTIMSGAVTMPWLIMGIKTQAIILLPLVKDRLKGKQWEQLVRFLENKIYTNSDQYLVIKTMKELIVFFERWSKNNSK